MTLTDGPGTLAARRELLRSLARTWQERNEEAWRHALLAAVCPSLSERELTLTWDEYLDAQNAADALETGAMHWDQFEPDLTCPDRQQTARRDAEEWAEGVMDVLLYGHGRTGNGE